MLSAYVLPLLLAGLAWQSAFADPLYKWVDSAGKVNYSSSPPPAGTPAEKVQPLPQPSVEEIRQAEESLERTQELARELEDERLRQEAEEAEAARLRALQSPPPPVVIEQPIYPPVYYPPAYYPPVMKPPPRRHPDKLPPRKPREEQPRRDAPF